MIGIGRYLVKELIKLNAHVIAVSQTQNKLDSLADEIKSNKLETVCVDLGNWNETDAKLANLCNKVDYLVNNAGYALNSSVTDVTQEEVDQIFNVNLKGPINMIRLVSRGMKERNFGSIVNVSSVAGIAALDGHLVYASSKAALDMVTKVSAKELGKYNVRVNSVNPTVVMTQMAVEHWSEPKKKEAMVSKIPMARFVEVSEVVDPIIFLLSDKSSMINGITMPIDGGFVAS